MKLFVQFLKNTLIGGLMILLPLWVTILLLLKAIKAAMAMLKPLAKLIPQNVVHEDMVALGLLVVISFLIGLAIRTTPGQRIQAWIAKHIFERIPGFSIVSSMARQLGGDVREHAFQPALVEIEEALAPAFIVEEHDDGQLTVFVSSSPTPMAGTIYILPPERVHPVDVPLYKAMSCISKWGTGARAMRAAMHNPNHAHS